MCEHTTPVEGCMVSTGHSDGRPAGWALAPDTAIDWRQMKKAPTGERATITIETTGMQGID